VERVDQLVRTLDATRVPAGVATRLIAIDGPGGAGKTTLAMRLAEELRAAVVHTDDFATWDNPLDWWPEMIESVLKPLAGGAEARYQPTSWDGKERVAVHLEPGGTVLIEGVGASREVFRPFLAYAIWIETDRAVRLREESTEMVRPLGRIGADGWRPRTNTSRVSIPPATLMWCCGVTEISGVRFARVRQRSVVTPNGRIGR
jgi:Cytidylate kinase